MPFTSLSFVFLFLPITVAGYFLLNKKISANAGRIWLVAASLLFYGLWNILFVPILLFSICVNFFFGQKILNLKVSARPWLIGGIAFNLALLCYFKYANFFIDGANLASDSHLATHVFLPLGVSFFTLQQIAYLADTYEGLTKEKSFLNYLMFVTFFPYITSGPITHHREAVPDLINTKHQAVDWRNIAVGLFIFSIGLFKKVMIASDLGMLVDAAHTGAPLTFIDAWEVSWSYMLQLYFDFSGYSDMAIGLGLLFNVTLPLNFNSPLKATNIVEFWRRWHMSLSNFMRTYIFTAVMRAHGKASFEFSLCISFITMVMLGMWHGAGWNYVAFGIIHGFAVVIFSIWQKFKIKLPKWLGWFLLANTVNLSLIPIRAHDFSETVSIIKGMVGLNGFALPPDLANNYPKLKGLITFQPLFVGGRSMDLFLHSVLLLAVIANILALKNSMELAKSFRPNETWLAFTLFLFIVPILNISHISEFIYFQF